MPASDRVPRSGAPQGAKPAWLSIDVVFEDGDWPDQGRVDALVREAAAAVAAHPLNRAVPSGEACIALSSDAHVQSLNANFRGSDKPTNVLSFPAARLAVPQSGVPLGDIVIARETVEREAREKQIPFADHLRHLTVHGLLHLLGYDHETEGDAIEMERIETEILARIGVPDPYADPATSSDDAS